MDILYRSIVKQLQTKVTQPLWIDLEAGQLEAMDENYPMQLPAVFIDLANCQWQDLSDGLQMGLMEINIRLAIDVYHDFHGSSPTLQDAADQLKLINQVHAALHTFGGGIILADDSETVYTDVHFSPLTRTSFNSERRADGLRVFNMTYTTQIYDNHAVPVYTTVQATPVVCQPVPPHDPIPIDYWGGVFNNTKTRILLDADLIPENITFKAGYVIELIDTSASDYTTYPGKHVIENPSSISDFIIDVPYNPDEPYSDFVLKLVQIPYQ